jgi:hypothetical protein
MMTTFNNDCYLEVPRCHTPMSPFTVCFTGLSGVSSLIVRVHVGNEIALYSLLTGVTTSPDYNLTVIQQSSFTVSVDGAQPEIWPQRYIIAPGGGADEFLQSNSLLVSTFRLTQPPSLAYIPARSAVPA